jgi:RNA-directed DNA polymerase
MAFQELDRYVWLRLRKWLEKKRQTGPKGGTVEFAAQDVDEKWVWRYRAVQTRLIYHRPSFKRNWPNPYLDKVKSEQYILPPLKVLWGGYTEAPTYEVNRREVLKRAGGVCERCGTATKLTVHHKHRVKRGKRSLAQADHRPEMLIALCGPCHAMEHKAENISRIKTRNRKTRQARE